MNSFVASPTFVEQLCEGWQNKQAIKAGVIQLLLLYVQWGPRNYEKCKVFRLIYILIISLNKFRFVAQVATLGNFVYWHNE